MARERVFLVEDDAPLRASLERVLGEADFDVVSFGAGDEALAALAASATPPDLILTDFVLPGRNGAEICAAARHLAPRAGLVIMSTRSEELDVIIGLGAGADDYIIKPFRPRELVARLRTSLRKAQPAAPIALERAAVVVVAEPPRAVDEAVVAGPVCVAPATRRASYGGAALTLTRAEFDILLALARRPGEVVPRGELLQIGSGTQLEAYERNVDSHIARLRKKLREAGAAPELIRTVHGVGYTLMSGELGELGPSGRGG